jgi:hypothetical protein
MMKQMGSAAKLWILLLVGIMAPTGLHGQRHPIDTRRSVMTIRVYKSGLFSVFAHNHTITAPIGRGDIEDSAKPSVELWVDAGKLQVLDPDLSAKDRGEVQRTMEGPEVLDVSRFSEIHFRSTAVEKTGADRWMVRGDLDLHGKTRPVQVEVARSAGRYRGSTTLKQRDFGMTPVRIAGGTVKVKDAVKVEFEVVLAR